MARVTVEDCLKKINNRFELVLVATRRARQLNAGSESQLPWENDKPTVMALREVAAGLVDQSVLDEAPQKDTEDPFALPEEPPAPSVGPDFDSPANSL